MTSAATASQHPIHLSAAERAALAEDVNILVRLHDREPDADLIARLKSADPSQWFSLALEGEAFAQGRALFLDSLGALSDPPAERDMDVLAADYAAIYLNYDYQAAATESVWRDEENLERQAAMFMTREWYARYGVTAPDWRVRSDDHLVNELQFLSLLLGLTDKEQSLGDCARFLRDHPIVWFPEFAKRVTTRCEAAFFAASALVTHAYLEKLAAVLGAATGVDMSPPQLILRPMATNPPTMPDCGSPRGDNPPPRKFDEAQAEAARKRGHILFQNNADGRQSRV